MVPSIPKVGIKVFFALVNRRLTGGVGVFGLRQGQCAGQGAAIFRGKGTDIPAGKGKAHALSPAITNNSLQRIMDALLFAAGIQHRILGFAAFYDKQGNIRAQLLGAFQILHHVSQTLPRIVLADDHIAGVGVVQLRLFTVILQLSQTVGNIFPRAGKPHQLLSFLSLLTAANTQLQPFLVGVKADDMHQLQLFNGAVVGE